jgi:hypothetical protein
MLLRRTIKHLKNQNWSAVVLEFMLIVLGIFVALQANTWNEARKNQIDEQLFLSQLHEDIVLVEELSGRVRDRRLDRLKSLIDATDVLFGRRARKMLNDEECRAVGSSHYFNIAISDLPSTGELMSTGRMAIIQDKDLRTALVGLQQINATLVFLINLQIEGTIDLPSEYPVLIRLESYFDSNLDEVNTHLQCDTDEMRANPKFLNNISENVDRYDAYVTDGLAPWSLQIDKVHQLVDDSIGIQHD